MGWRFCLIRRSRRFARVSLFCVLGAAAILVIALPPRPAYAQQTLQEVLKDYNSTLKKHNELKAKHDAGEEVDISELMGLGRRLQALRFQIKEMGGKVPKKNVVKAGGGGTPGGGNPPSGGKKPTGTKTASGGRPFDAGSLGSGYKSGGKIKELTDKYNDLQDKIRKKLLVNKKKWSRGGAIKYGAELRDMWVELVKLEIDIACKLGGPDEKKKTGKDRREINKEKSWEQKAKGWDKKANAQNKKINAAKAEAARALAAFNKYPKAGGPPAVGAGRANAADKYQKALKKVQREQGKQDQMKLKAARWRKKIKDQQIARGLRRAKEDGSKFQLHAKWNKKKKEWDYACDSWAYKNFLSDGEFQTFIDQGALRAIATGAVRPGTKKAGQSGGKKDRRTGYRVPESGTGSGDEKRLAGAIDRVMRGQGESSGTSVQVPFGGQEDDLSAIARGEAKKRYTVPSGENTGRGEEISQAGNDQQTEQGGGTETAQADTSGTAQSGSTSAQATESASVQPSGGAQSTSSFGPFANALGPWIGDGGCGLELLTLVVLANHLAMQGAGPDVTLAVNGNEATGQGAVLFGVANHRVRLLITFAQIVLYAWNQSGGSCSSTFKRG